MQDQNEIKSDFFNFLYKKTTSEVITDGWIGESYDILSRGLMNIQNIYSLFQPSPQPTEEVIVSTI